MFEAAPWCKRVTTRQRIQQYLTPIFKVAIQALHWMIYSILWTSLCIQSATMWEEDDKTWNDEGAEKADNCILSVMLWQWKRKRKKKNCEVRPQSMDPWLRRRPSTHQDTVRLSKKCKDQFRIKRTRHAEKGSLLSCIAIPALTRSTPRSNSWICLNKSFWTALCIPLTWQLQIITCSLPWKCKCMEEWKKLKKSVKELAGNFFKCIWKLIPHLTACVKMDGEWVERMKFKRHLEAREKTFQIITIVRGVINNSHGKLLIETPIWLWSFWAYKRSGPKTSMKAASNPICYPRKKRKDKKGEQKYEVNKKIRTETFRQIFGARFRTRHIMVSCAMAGYFCPISSFPLELFHNAFYPYCRETTSISLTL